MNHLRSRVRPDLCVLLGHLNSTGAPGTPLASALGALGPLSAWHRLVPPATPTNFTTRHGSPRSTAIDHIFATGPIASHTHHVLPCHTSHAMVLAQVTLHHRSCSGPLPTAGWTARDPPRPPRAPHPHGATSYPADRRYPRARPGLRPPAGCAARPPVRRAQGQAPGNIT